MFIADKFFDVLFKRFYPNATAKEFSKIPVVAAVFTSAVLFVLKIIASFLTKSITLEASTIDSFIDTVASLFAFLAIGYSFKEADEDHGFGHGKIEGLTALGQMFFVLFACYNIFHEAWEGFVDPKPIEHQFIGVFVMVVSSLLVYILVSLQKYSVHKTKSVIVSSDSLHYSADLLMNIGVLVSLILANYVKYLDSIVGLLVCVYVLVSAIKICNHSLRDLMDRELPEKYKNRILEKIKANPNVLKIIRLRTRSSGTKRIVYADILIDKNIPFVEVYEITECIAKDVRTLFVNSEVLIVPHPNE